MNQDSQPIDHSLRNIILICLLVLAGIMLWYIRDLLQPLITAGLLAYLLSPLINLVVRLAGVKRKTAANLVFFFMLATVITLLVTVIPAVLNDIRTVFRDLNSQLNIYQTTLERPIDLYGVQVYLGGAIAALRISFSEMFALPRPEQAWQILQTTSRGFLWFLVIMVTTYNLMTEWERMRDWLIRLAPDGYQGDVRRLYAEIRAIWLGYLAGQVRLMIILAIVYSVAWAVIGLPGAFYIGILAGFLNLVPEVGPGFTALLAILVALLEGSLFLSISNGWFAILTGGIYLILNNFKTIYLQPRILGKSVSLPEGLVFVAIIAAIILQGILGVLLVVPVLASVMIIGRYVRRKLLGLPGFEENRNSAPTQPHLN